MRHNFFALAAFAALLPMGAAYGQPVIQSQEGIALENQILQLQQQIQQMPSGGGGSSLGGSNEQPSNNAAPDSSIVTNLLNQVNQLQSQVQQLNGQVDTLQNQINTQHDATEKEIGDMKFQMGNGGAPGPGASNNPPPTDGSSDSLQAGPPPSQQAAASDGSPRTILHDGQTAFASHNYANAEAAARSVLASSKTSPESYKAQYLLAQSLAAQGKSQDAAIAYDDAYNRNRTGPVAPQSLLGLASSLAAINQNEAACDTISSLNSQFPTPPPGMQPRIDSVAHRAHCS